MTTRPIRSLVLDFDGTLVDSRDVKRQAFYEAVTGIPSAAETLDGLLNAASTGDRYDVFRQLVRRVDCGGRSAEELTRAYGSYCEQQILPLLAEPALTTTLGILRELNLVLFIASATPEKDLLSMLSKTPLLGQFAGVYGRPRSKTEIIGDLVARRGWQPTEVLVVGDAEDDREAALAVGCHFTAVSPDDLAFRSPAPHRVSSVRELPHLLGVGSALEPAEDNGQRAFARGD